MTDPNPDDNQVQPPAGGAGGDPPAPPAGQPPAVDLTKTELGAPAAPIATVSDVLGAKVGIADWARVGLAASLILILAILTLGTCWYVLRHPKREPAIEAFLKLVFTPIIGLVGSVVGFYFGSRAGGSGG